MQCNAAVVLCETSGLVLPAWVVEAAAACCDHIPINLAPVHLHSALPLEAFFYGGQPSTSSQAQIHYFNFISVVVVVVVVNVAYGGTR